MVEPAATRHHYSRERYLVYCSGYRTSKWRTHEVYLTLMQIFCAGLCLYDDISERRNSWLNKKRQYTASAVQILEENIVLGAIPTITISGCCKYHYRSSLRSDRDSDYIGGLYVVYGKGGCTPIADTGSFTLYWGGGYLVCIGRFYFVRGLYFVSLTLCGALLCTKGFTLYKGLYCVQGALLYMV